MVDDIKFQCPHCGQHLEAPQDMGGSEVTCPTCDGAITVPCVLVAEAVSNPETEAEEQSIETPEEPLTQKRTPGKPARLKWVIMGGVAILIACAIGLSALLLQKRDVSRLHATEDSERGPAPSGEIANPEVPALPEDIGRGEVPVEVLSARLTRGTESLTYPWSGTFRVWHLRLVLKNTGRDDLVFGNLCGLFESTSDEADYQGLVQLRPCKEEKKGWFTAAAETLANQFAVGNAQINNDDNNPSHSIRANMIQFTVGGGDTVDPSFGTLPPGQRFVLHLAFKLGSMMKDEYLSTATFVSPALFSPGGKSARGAILLFKFARPETGSLDDAPWRLAERSQQSLELDSLSAVVNNSKSPSSLRVVGINYLAEIYGQAGAEVIRDRLNTVKEPRGEVRAAAILALGRLEDANCVSSLSQMVSDPEQPDGIRRCAAGALGAIGLPDALPSLRRCVHDNEENVATDAVSAIGAIGGKGASDILYGLVQDKDFKYAEQAARALGECGASAAAALADSVSEERTAVAKAAVAALGKLLQREEIKQDGYTEEAKETYAGELRSGMPALSGPAAETVFDALDRALRDPRTDVAEASADALADVPGPRAGQILLKAVEERREPIAAIVEALRERREPAAGSLIMGLLQQPTSEETCKKAIDVAVTMNVPGTEGRLIAMAGKGDKTIRQKAIEALGAMKSVKARDVLLGILGDSSEPEDLGRAALSALAEIPGGQAHSTLLKIARETNPHRWKCLDYLCKLDSPEADAAIRSALAETAKGDEWERKNLKREFEKARSVRGAQSLAHKLKSKDADIRCEAADGIKEKKDRSMLTSLKQAVKDENETPALWRLGSALKALECRDEAMVPSLLGKLKSEEDSVVLAAASLLRYISGVHNGPFKGGTKEDWAEDIGAWETWWSSR